MGNNIVRCSPHRPPSQGLRLKSEKCSYTGFLLNGLKHGNGTCSCPEEGYSYEGDWFEDRMTGIGILTDNEKVYSGGFLRNMNHGAGSLQVTA